MKEAGSGKWIKGNRDEVDGKRLLGPFDTYVADGGRQRVWRPLYWRIYRYLQLDIQAVDEALTIEDIRGTFTGYPFRRSGEFSVDDKNSDGELHRILATGRGTSRLCAHETYMDYPFYEQLQYAGDARIQMLVSLYLTKDARLMKNGIALLKFFTDGEGRDV